MCIRKISLLLCFLCAVTAASALDIEGPGNRTDILFGNELNTDPLTGRKYRMIFKVNTLQVLFSEAPVSVELFGMNNISHQFQAGIIFPLEEDSFLREFFQTSGTSGTASEKGFISYRASPYNNHGMSFKYECRKYFESFYFGPQLMYKHVSYEDAAFYVYNAGTITPRQESKFTGIFGLGMTAGRQTYFHRQATDWYVCIGLRARNMKINIHQPGGEMNAEPLTRFSVYPFLNFGFRSGLIIL